MWRLIKWLIILAILCSIGLVAYTYIGPFFGVQFTPAQVEIRQPVVLHAN